MTDADAVFTLSETLVPSDAACYDNSYLTMFERIAYHSPELRSPNIANMHFFIQKCIFF